jgi:hypothetical protein
VYGLPFDAEPGHPPFTPINQMLLGFKKRFVEPIQKGTKIHTFRELPKRMPKPGETLHMYTGLRTKHCELICKDYKLKSLQKLLILFESYDPTVFVDGKRLTWHVRQDMYVNDGFADYVDFNAFWNWNQKDERKSFEGVIIHWTDLRY